MCFFYSALFPASFFFGFAILLIQYYTDKVREIRLNCNRKASHSDAMSLFPLDGQFCLLRIWGFAPSLGNSLAVYSRRYFFTGATVAFIISSSYAFAQFPYDELCDPVNGTVTRTEIAVTGVTLLNETEQSNGPVRLVDVIVGQEEPVHYCPQGFRDQEGFAFPPSVDFQPEGFRWMTDSQVR